MLLKVVIVYLRVQLCTMSLHWISAAGDAVLCACLGMAPLLLANKLACNIRLVILGL